MDVLRLWVLSHIGGLTRKCTNIVLLGIFVGIVIRLRTRYYATEHALRNFDQIVFGRSTTSRFEIVSTKPANVDKWIS